MIPSEAHQRKPHVAMFLRNLGGGGAERLMVSLANAFVTEGLHVDLVLAQPGGPYSAQVSEQVNVIELSATRLPASLPKLVQYLRQNQPQALLTGLHYPSEIAICSKYLARVKTRVVIIEHNTLSQEAQHLAQLSVRLSPYAARLIYPWADAIVTVSHGVAKDLAMITGLPVDRMTTIYNPVITPDIREQSQVPIDHVWLQPQQAPVILSMGRLEKQKDFPTLIYAFQQVRKTRDVKLIILGDGTQRAALQQLILNLNLSQDIDLPGFFLNPYPYLAKAKLFVLSSIWEGFANVIVEALATQTPVVSTNCPSGPAEILDHGRYGHLVPVGDPNAMAQAIEKVLDGERKTVPDQWLDQFTLGVGTRKYRDILQV